MKTPAILSAAAVLFLVGCVYDSPLTQEHTIPIDPAVLGLWEQIPKEGEKTNPDERILVMKFSATEYSIQYPSGIFDVAKFPNHCTYPELPSSNS